MAHDINFPSGLDDFEEVVDETTPGSGTVFQASYINPILSSVATMQLHYGVNPMSLQAFAEDVDHTQGLVWGWLGGPIRYDNTVRAIATGTINLTDDTTNYVFYDWADNAVEVNTTGFPSGAYLPIAQIVTASSVITGTWASRDKRAILQLGSSGGSLVHSELSSLAYADSGHTGFQASLGYTAENAANKSTSTSLGTSDTLYPSQNAVKSYVDAKVTDAIADGETAKAPTQNAVHDALALKSPLASPTFTGTVTTPAIKITTGAGAGKVLKSDADGDATWESSAASGYSYPMDFRLTLESGVPVSTTAQTAKTTLYLTPYKGNQIALYYDSAWVIYSVSEMSISLSGLTASTPYDVWCYSNSGTPTLELLAWTNATTRATALTRQDGVYVKTGATTRRYIGTVYINASGGQTDDTPGGSNLEAKRYVWNYYNRVYRNFYVTTSTASWSYTTNTCRACNNQAELRISFISGLQEDGVIVNFWQWGWTGSSSGYLRSGLAVDATDTMDIMDSAGNAVNQRHTLKCTKYGSYLGYHYIQAVEYGDTAIVLGGGTDNFKLSGLIAC